MNRIGCLLLAIAGIAAVIPARALELNPLFSAGAVLQSGKSVPVWGTATPGERVRVRYLGWLAETRADASGAWTAVLPAMPAGSAGTLEAAGDSGRASATDVLTGEVWLCAGQSNMQFPLGRVTDADRELADTDYPRLRVFKVQLAASASPRQAVSGRWRASSPASAGGFSAVAYLFARELHRRLGVPVGVIVAAKGGAPIESFLSPEAFAASPEAQSVRERLDASRSRWLALPSHPLPKIPFIDPAENTMPLFGPDGYAEPSATFNAMIGPVIRYGVRGNLWYQGEANTSTTFSQPTQYSALFHTLIGDWRRRAGQGDRPFYFVQLPACNLPARDVTGQMWATLRAGQASALDLPQTAMAVTYDLGNPGDVHPPWKQPVAHRLALLAEHRVYGQNVADQGPRFRVARLKEGAARVVFLAAEGGLRAAGGQPLGGFELAGADGVFHPAGAHLAGDEVTVASPDVSRPALVRYAWHQDPGDANLSDATALPAPPFQAAVLH